MQSQVAPAGSAAYRSIVTVCLGAGCISFAAPLVRYVQAPPDVTGFYRCFFASIVLFAIVGISGRGKSIVRPSRALLAWASLAGLFFALDLIVWHRSIYLVGAGLATLLANTQVFWVAGLSALLLGERPGWRFARWAVIALLGIFVLTWPRMQGSALSLPGVGLGLLAAAFYAAYLMVLRRSQRLERTLSPTLNLAIITGVMAVLLWLTAQAAGASLLDLSARQVFGLLLLGLIPQVVGWTLISKGLPPLPPALGAMLLLLQPVLATLWGMLFFQEPLGPYELGGMALTLLAIYQASVVRARGA